MAETEVEIPHPYWSETLKGRPFDLQRPQPDMFDIEEIATALSHTCRFAGQIPVFYSVAQHSVHVMQLVRPPLRRRALLHDAREAFVGDMVGPFLRLIGSHTRIVDFYLQQIDEECGRAFGVNLLPIHPEVHRADMQMLIAERRDLKPNLPLANGGWGSHLPSFEDVAHIARVTPWTPEYARTVFLEAFHETAQP